MGKAIEQVSDNQHVEISWRIGSNDTALLNDTLLRQADVVIEFTRPEAAFDNVMRCLKAGVPVVSGTTGWTDRMDEAIGYCEEMKGAMLWASNFSIGVNLFFAINSYLAELMNSRPEYAVSMTEIHHIHKLDAPSGTAISLARDILAQVERLHGHHLASNTEPAPAGSIPIHAIREGEVPGTHRIRWQSAIDELTIEHKAHSRAGFAWGALTAAQWLHGRKGVFSMNDVLQIS